jgi:hypothetical protein
MALVLTSRETVGQADLAVPVARHGFEVLLDGLGELAIFS